MKLHIGTIDARAAPAFKERGATLIEAALFTVIALGIVIGGIVFRLPPPQRLPTRFV